ncbi:MAG: DUF3987 domain-containing protein, partial [Xanthomonadales bacterium]|nr:DUF3987 domain-containing protein [Xanthomonadales bacterium]
NATHPVKANSNNHTELPVSAPEPIRRPVPPAQPYPLEALGELLGGAARSLREVIQAPDAICGAATLAAAALAAQGLADVTLSGRVYPTSLWFLSVAESGERKSSVDAQVMRAAREYEVELTRDHNLETARHFNQVAEWNTRCEEAKRSSKKNRGDGLAAALDEIGPAPSPPRIPRVTVADFTAEGVAKLLLSGRPSMGAFTDEAALVFGGHGMTKEASARTAGAFCKLWDDGSLDRVRATDGAQKLFGRRMSMHLMAQPVIAESAFADGLLTGQGFLARCLISWPESTAGSRPLVDTDLSRCPRLNRFQARLAELFREPLPLADDEIRGLQPPRLELTTPAMQMWRQLHDAIEKHMAPQGRYVNCKAWASKTPEQALRIAGVLAVIDGHRHIQPVILERAAEIAIWHLSEAERIVGNCSLSPALRDAEVLLAWFHETGRELAYSADVLRLGPSCVRQIDRFKRAMRELELTGWAVKLEGGTRVDGTHRRNVWRIAPKAAER